MYNQERLACAAEQAIFQLGHGGQGQVGYDYDARHFAR
jgi:hypothetical protein